MLLYLYRCIYNEYIFLLSVLMRKLERSKEYVYYVQATMPTHFDKKILGLLLFCIIILFILVSWLLLLVVLFLHFNRKSSQSVKECERKNFIFKGVCKELYLLRDICACIIVTLDLKLCRICNRMWKFCYPLFSPKLSLDFWDL